MKKIFISLMPALVWLTFVPGVLAISFDYSYQISSGTLDGSDYVASLDSNSNLHAVYVVGGQIRYRYNLNNEEIVASGASPALTINPTTLQPAITFSAEGVVNFAWRNIDGTWQTVSIGPGSSASLALDGAGITHIAYLNDDDSDAINELFYTSGYGYNGTEVFASSTRLIDGTYCNDLSCRVTDNFLKPNIKVDSDNNYHVMVLEQYRNTTLVPINQDYLRYFNASSNSQSPAQSADSLILRHQFLALNSTNLPIAVRSDGDDNLRTFAFNPESSTWTDEALGLIGNNPNLFFSTGLQSLVYDRDGLVNYHENDSSTWGEAVFVATGTKPVVLADNYRYVYYLNDNQLYLSANREVPDVSAPTATLVSTPDSSTLSTSAHFVIGGTDVEAYKYKLDGGTFGEEKLVDQAVDLSGLSLGGHNFSVIGRDVSGNWQAEDSPTTYAWTIVAPAPPSGGGGGGGGAPSVVSTTTEPIGRVLGESTFQFKRTLRLGMEGFDVQELQNILQKAGFLKIKKTTKYFGPATQKALIAWKRKNKIRPYTGVISKINLKYLNSL